MKQKGSKHGGSRTGAGRPHKWQGGETKLVRIPVTYVDKILQIVAYMDANEGQLPTDIAFFIEGDCSPPATMRILNCPTQTTTFITSDIGIATGKNFEWRAFFPNCGFNAQAPGTSDAKI